MTQLFQVAYFEDKFDLRIPAEGVRFLWELYNYRSIILENMFLIGPQIKMKVNALKDNIGNSFQSLHTKSPKAGSGNNRGEGGNDINERQDRGSTRADQDAELLHELSDIGYTLELSQDCKGTWSRLTVRPSFALGFGFTKKVDRTILAPQYWMYSRQSMGGLLSNESRKRKRQSIRCLPRK